MIYYKELEPEQILLLETPTFDSALNEIRRNFKDIVKGTIRRVMVVFPAPQCSRSASAETICDLITKLAFSVQTNSTRYSSLVRDFRPPVS